MSIDLDIGDSFFIFELISLILKSRAIFPSSPECEQTNDRSGFTSFEFQLNFSFSNKFITVIYYMFMDSIQIFNLTACLFIQFGSLLLRFVLSLRCYQWSMLK